MIRPRHVLVPLLPAALAFAVAQPVPGFGIFVVLGGTFIWMTLERRRQRLGMLAFAALEQPRSGRDPDGIPS